jgi:hypothetical protein
MCECAAVMISSPSSIQEVHPMRERAPALVRGWLPLLLLPAGVLLLESPEWPRWAFLWALAIAIFIGVKWLTWRRTPAPGAPWWRHAGYLLAWPGLDPVAFLGPGPVRPEDRPTPQEWAAASLRLAAGAALFRGARAAIGTERELLLGWLGMTGLILMLHFGAFHLLSAAWRAAGVDARPLMLHPSRSRSPSEFWGRRWNTAFRDLTHRFLFRPIADRLGPRRAILAGFLASGLVHDLVISLPAGGGYGLPTLYFVIQGLALLAERSQAGRALGLGRGLRGRLFTLLVVGLPAFFLFHPPFVRSVIVPFMRAAGAT